MKFEDLPRTPRFQAGDTVTNHIRTHTYTVVDGTPDNSNNIAVRSDSGHLYLAPETDFHPVPSFTPGFYRVWNDGDIGYRHNTFGHANNSELYPNDDAVAGILEITDDGTTTMHPAISGGGDQ